MTSDSQWMPISAIASHRRWRTTMCEHPVKAGMPDVLVPIANDDATTRREFCGFRPNHDEGRTMGLASPGDASRFIDAACRTGNIDERNAQIHVDTTP